MHRLFLEFDFGELNDLNTAKQENCIRHNLCINLVRFLKRYSIERFEKYLATEEGWKA